jgi:hypothetical protein
LLAAEHDHRDPKTLLDFVRWAIFGRRLRKLILQLPSSRNRIHFVRCPVTVHQFSDGTLGISYQGRLLARYDALGEPLPPFPKKERAAIAVHRPTRLQNLHFSARTQKAIRSAGEKLSVAKTTDQFQEELVQCLARTQSP